MNLIKINEIWIIYVIMSPDYSNIFRFEVLSLVRLMSSSNNGINRERVKLPCELCLGGVVG